MMTLLVVERIVVEDRVVWLEFKQILDCKMTHQRHGQTWVVLFLWKQSLNCFPEGLVIEVHVLNRVEEGLKLASIRFITSIIHLFIVQLRPVSLEQNDIKILLIYLINLQGGSRGQYWIWWP